MNPCVFRRELGNLGNKKRAALCARFFKTGPGEYAEGDCFLGVPVPQVRNLVRRAWRNFSIGDAERLLRSKWHEERQAALFILIHIFAQADEGSRKKIYRLYLQNTHYINNWDLVDGTAEHIVGAFLYDKSRQPLYRLARSKHLWERRIAMLSTFYFIKKGEAEDALAIAAVLLRDRHDLIHKAVGWMLREIGKRLGPSVEAQFLDRFAAQMPRTMLRYAIEHFSPAERARYLLVKENKTGLAS